MENILHLLEPSLIIKTVGIIGLFFIIFAESGLFFGFFFPGDSLLFTAGFLASQNILDITVLLIGSFLCAVLGDNVGYWFGKEIGPKIFKKEDSIFFHRDHLTRAKKFYEKYGKKTIILARFVPIVRTFAPIVAGVGEMRYRDFMVFNLIGGLVWSFGMVLAGYFLGRAIPGVDEYILPIIILIIFSSVLPVFAELIRSKK